MAFPLHSTANVLLGFPSRGDPSYCQKEALYRWYLHHCCRRGSVHCLSSKGKRGFGQKKVKDNSVKTSGEGRSVANPASRKQKSTFGQPDTLTGGAPVLATDSKGKSTSPVYDRQFEERLEAVRRSALEQKKVEESKLYQAIDYDAPAESEQTTISLGTKIGVGVAVVIFGLVFAFGDFLPSVSPDEKVISTAQSKLSKEEASVLKARRQQYETTLAKSPDDLGSLEGAAVTSAELGEYTRASSLLEKLVKERPKDYEAYRLLGEVKFELKDYSGSINAYRTAASAASASGSINLDTLRGLTNALLAANKPDEAVKTLLDIRESLNKQKVASQDQSVGKEDNVDENLQIDPVQVDLLLGKAYSDWGHISDAVSVYDTLIAKQPNDFRGYLAKGIILKENGNSADAERMFIQARFFAPEKAKALVDRYARR